MKQSRRVQAALEKDATLRLARFERLESWEGLSPGDPVRIAGHRGGAWRFSAFVTNTSNGASWVEVSEVMAAGRRRGKAPAAAPPGDPDAGDGDAPAAAAGETMTRARSFRPEQVIPLKRRTRRRREPRPAEVPPPGPAVQVSLFDAG